jgi:hypothetical protein
MRMKLVLACAMALGLATAAAAETGTVVSVEGMNVTLLHEDGTQKTHTLAPNVTIRTETGETMAATDLARLAQKRVEVELDDADRITSIEVAAAGAAEPGVAGEPAPTEEPVAEEPTATPPVAQEEPAMEREMEPGAMEREADEPTMARAELPDTASPLPLVAIVGGLSLAGAFAARAYRRR